MKPLSVRIDDETMGTLAARASRLGVSVSTLVREMLEAKVRLRTPRRFPATPAETEASSSNDRLRVHLHFTAAEYAALRAQRPPSSGSLATYLHARIFSPATNPEVFAAALDAEQLLQYCQDASTPERRDEIQRLARKIRDRLCQL